MPAVDYLYVCVHVQLGVYEEHGQVFQKHVLHYYKVASVKNCKHIITLQITWWGGLTYIIQLDF